MSQILLIAGVLILSAGVVFAFRNSASGAALSFIGLSALRSSKYIELNNSIMLFWALAVLIVLTINFWKTDKKRASNVCRNFIVGGAFAGMAVGLVAGYASMVAGAALGALLGGIAWSRRPAAGEATAGLWRTIVEIGLPL